MSSSLTTSSFNMLSSPSRSLSCNLFKCSSLTGKSWFGVPARTIHWLWTKCMPLYNSTHFSIFFSMAVLNLTAILHLKLNMATSILRIPIELCCMFARNVGWVPIHVNWFFTSSTTSDNLFRNYDEVSASSFNLTSIFLTLYISPARLNKTWFISFCSIKAWFRNVLMSI